MDDSHQDDLARRLEARLAEAGRDVAEAPRPRRPAAPATAGAGNGATKGRHGADGDAEAGAPAGTGGGEAVVAAVRDQVVAALASLQAQIEAAVTQQVTAAVEPLLVELEGAVARQVTAALAPLREQVHASVHEQVTAALAPLHERLDQLATAADAGVDGDAASADAAARLPGLDDVNEQLELLRTQLEVAFRDTDERDGALDARLRAVATGVATCLEDVGTMRAALQQLHADTQQLRDEVRSVAQVPADGGSELATLVDALDKGLHELAGRIDDVGARTRVDTERVEAALAAASRPRTPVDAKLVEAAVGSASLQLAADIADVKAEIGRLGRTIGVQSDAVRDLHATLEWVKERVLRR